jgi:spectinomycin phosphotransferase
MLRLFTAALLSPNPVIGNGITSGQGMKEAPPELALDRLRAALLEHWGIRVRKLEYLPVGFGAHHWRATDGSKGAYFLALHDLGPDTDVGFNELMRALETACWLRTAGDLEFVVAPVRNRAGGVVHRYAETEALAVYPWLECRARRVLDAPDVGRLLVRLHASTTALPPGFVRSDHLAIPRRAYLERALTELEQPWESGPYGQPARDRLSEASGPTRNLLALYDRLAGEALATRSDWVITHGEPYGPNLVEADDGRTMLVDWDSALLAPRERDLWEFPSTGPASRAYVDLTGVSPGAARLRLYRAWYDLAETAIYVDQFGHPHTGDLNDAEAWSNFLHHLPSHTNWPELG